MVQMVRKWQRACRQRRIACSDPAREGVIKDGLYGDKSVELLLIEVQIGRRAPDGELGPTPRDSLPLPPAQRLRCARRRVAGRKLLLQPP
jgi:hypothetical protein